MLTAILALIKLMGDFLDRVQRVEHQQGQQEFEIRRLLESKDELRQQVTNLKEAEMAFADDLKKIRENLAKNQTDLTKALADVATDAAGEMGQEARIAAVEAKVDAIGSSVQANTAATEQLAAAIASAFPDAVVAPGAGPAPIP